MKIIALFFLVASECLAQQQVIVFGSGGQGQLGKPRDLTEAQSVDPNSFLFADWLEGIVFTEGSSKAYKIHKLKYNVLDEKFEYNEKGTTFYLDSKNFSRFMLLKDNDTLRFQNNIGDSTNGLSALGYYQIIYKGTNTWLCKYKKSLVNDPAAAYGSSKNKVIQDYHSFHMLTPADKSVTIKLSKRFFVKQLGIQGDELQNYLDRQFLSFDKESDFKKIAKWLDSRIKVD